MNVTDEIKKIGEQQRVITDHLKNEEVKRVKKKDVKLPFGWRAKASRAIRSGRIVAIYLRANRALEFRSVKVFGGLIEIDGETYKAYEGGAVYYHKKFPFMVIFEWRLTPAGGIAETYRSRVIGGESEEDVAKKLGISDFAQQTIVRVIEKIEVDKEVGKKGKRKGMPIALIIVGVIILLFVLAPYLGF